MPLCGTAGRRYGNAVETIDLLLRKTEENGHDIALIYPDESGDYVRGLFIQVTLGRCDLKSDPNILKRIKCLKLFEA
jgi:hypothetical protein